MANIFVKYLLNLYFLNVDISLTMHKLKLKMFMCIKDIVVEGTVSQISDRGPGSFFFFIKSRKKYAKKINKKLLVFAIKQELRPRTEI